MRWDKWILTGKMEGERSPGWPVTEDIRMLLTPGTTGMWANHWGIRGARGHGLGSKSLEGWVAQLSPSPGLPWWLSGKESTCQSRRCRFNPWVRIPWSRKWQPTPEFLPGKSPGHRRLVGYRSWGHKRVRHDLVSTQQIEDRTLGWIWSWWLSHYKELCLIHLDNPSIVIRT